MKNVHTVTRPLWANDWKPPVSLGLGLWLGTGGLEWCFINFHTYLKSEFPSSITDTIFYILTSLIIAGLCYVAYGSFVLFKFKKYPRTFFYCFKRKTDKGTIVYTIGYFILKCLAHGRMRAEGASFDLNGTKTIRESRARWTSHIIGTTYDRENDIVCNILYRVNEDDLKAKKRGYALGLLQFKYIEKTTMRGAIEQDDAYRGHMQSIEDESTIYEVAYAERFSSRYRDQEELISNLDKHASLLISQLGKV